LDSASAERVKEIYTSLERNFGLHGVDVFPYPHISYRILDHYSRELVEERLHDTVARFKPFKVNASGIGIFLKPSPVLFIPVVRGTSLERIYRLLWRSFPPKESREGFYTADQWVPHITLARGDLTLDMLPEVVRLVSHFDFHWEITVNNLTFAAEVETRFVIQCSCFFQDR